MADTTTQLKHEVGYYVTVGDEGTTFNWCNLGFTEMTGAFNPTTQERQYIGESNRTTTTTALAPQWAFNTERVIGDAVNDDLNDICLAMLTGTLQASRTFVRVDLKTPHASVTGWFKALKSKMNVNIDNFDQGAPGEVISMTGNYSVDGTVEEGYFNPTTKLWSADPTQPQQ